MDSGGQDIRDIVPGLANAACPMPEVVTGGQPTEEHLRTFLDHGYKTILDLRAPDEPRPFDEPEAARRIGLEYVSLPVTPGTPSATSCATSRSGRSSSTAPRETASAPSSSPISCWMRGARDRRRWRRQSKWDSGARTWPGAPWTTWRGIRSSPGHRAAAVFPERLNDEIRAQESRPTRCAEILGDTRSESAAACHEGYPSQASGGHEAFGPDFPAKGH